jgi:hypothetical protein
VAALPAALWGLLPLWTTLQCSQRYTALPVIVTNSRAVWVALRSRGGVVFGIHEWAALVSSFENGRASSASFAEWCDIKRRMPTWQLTLKAALGGCVDAQPPLRASMGEVLAGWGLWVRAVTYGQEAPTP